MPTGTNAQLVGRRFGRLTVIKQIRKNGKKLWLCKCDCGSFSRTNSWGLTAGRTKSCGCLMREAISRPKRHGSARRHGKTYLYHIWGSMRGRCNNPKNKAYKNYG